MGTGVLKARVGGTWVPIMGSGGGGPGDVVGPIGAVDGDVVVYNGPTGKLVKDTGLSSAQVVRGPASVVDSNIAVFSGTTGKVLQDTGVPVAQVARRDQANTFVQDQTIQKGVPALLFKDTNQPANAQQFQCFLSGQQWIFRAATDAGVAQATPLVLDRAGNTFVGNDLYEKGRTTPMGHWINVPYSAANFTAAGGTWGVDAGDVLLNAYSVIGKTLIWMVSLQNTSPNTATRLLISLPGGFSGTVAPAPVAWAGLGQATNTAGVTIESENSTQLKIWRDRGGSGIGTGTNNFTFLFTAIVAIT